MSLMQTQLIFSQQFFIEIIANLHTADSICLLLHYCHIIFIHISVSWILWLSRYWFEIYEK